MTILDEIFATKRREVTKLSSSRPLKQVRRDAEARPSAKNFVAALRGPSPKPALIAEVKHASPSRGVLISDFNPLHLATIYQENGAAAISVLTDEPYFMGSLECLAEIAAEFNSRNISSPLLRKDFLFDPYQIYESRAAGADAVLLIAACLDEACLKDLQQLSHELGMAALVEVHNQDELNRVLKFSPRLVGINNRDLHTFNVNLATTRTLRPLIPPEVCVVAESGIHTCEDVFGIRDAGVDAILVGEALVTAQDIASEVRKLTQCA